MGLYLGCRKRANHSVSGLLQFRIMRTNLIPTYTMSTDVGEPCSKGGNQSLPDKGLGSAERPVLADRRSRLVLVIYRYWLKVDLLLLLPCQLMVAVVTRFSRGALASTGEVTGRVSSPHSSGLA